MDIDVILFDWGGTLAQVVGQDDRLRQGATMAASRLAPHSPGHVDDFVRRVLAAEAEAAADPEMREADLRQRLRDWTTRLDRPCEESAVQEALEFLYEAWRGSLVTLPGAPEALAELHHRGYRMGLVSNCMMPAPISHSELNHLGLGQHLDFAVFSSEVGYRKPSPVIYEQALRQVFNGAPRTDLSKVLFVGDSPTFDVIAPAKLGMKTALVTCHRGIWPAADYENARPDLRIDAVSELPALLP